MSDINPTATGAEALPVVAWLRENKKTHACQAVREKNSAAAWSHTYTALTPRDDAQAIIATLKAENARLRDEADQVRRAWLGHRDTGHLSLIEAAEKTVGGLHAENARLVRERDAAIDERDILLNDNMVKLAQVMTAADPMRWEVDFRNVVAAFHGGRHEFEIADIVAEARALKASKPYSEALPEITDRSWIGQGQRSALMSKFIDWQEAPVGDASRPFADAIDEHLDTMLRDYAREALRTALAGIGSGEGS